MMALKIYICIALMFLLAGVGAAAFTNPAATTVSSSGPGYQFTNPSISSMYSSSDISTYWPALAQQMESGQCEGNTDFLVMIPPGGCSPAVVRSDLLEEQNVPVFCQLESVKVNPLIKVSSIKSISFKGAYPGEISGVSFYPSRAALKSYTTLLGSPIVNNIGYVVIVLKKQNNESSMAKNVSGSLTATMYYDAEKAFGVGASEFYLQTMNENDWQTDWAQQTFWGGRGVMKLVDIQRDEVTVEVLTNNQDVIRSVKLKVGETSSEFYFPGFYCQAGMKLKLNSIVSPEDSVLLNIDGTTMDARVGTKLINGRCTVKSLDVFAGETGTVKIICDGKAFDLSLLNNYRANFTVGDKNSIRDLGDVVNSSTDNNLYLAYTGYVSGAEYAGMSVGTEFVVLIKDKTAPDKTVYSQIATKIENTFNGLAAGMSMDALKVAIRVGKYTNDDLIILNRTESLPDINFNGFVDKDSNPISGVASSVENNDASEYFEAGDEAIQELLKQYPTTTPTTTTVSTQQSFGEQGLLEEIDLIRASEGKLDYSGKKIELMNRFLELYPESPNANGVRSDLSMAQRTDSTNAYRTIYVNNEYHSIGVVKFKPTDSTGKGVELLVDGKVVKDDESGSSVFKVGQSVNLSKIAGNYPGRKDYLIIKDIKVDRIIVDAYNDTELKYKDQDIMFGENSDGTQKYKEFSFDKIKYKVVLNDLNVKKVAYVSLVSNLKTSSEANFTYNIGIEKRAIQLNPEKAMDRASELNKTIQRWEEKNAKIGSLVEKWKGVCLATGLALQVKNFVSGLSGESFARQNVMMVYRSKCENSAINPKTGESYNKASSDVCYNSLSDEIAKDVDAYSVAVESVNDEIETYGGKLDSWKSSGSCSIVIDGCKENVQAKDLNSWADVRQCLLNKKIQVSSATQDLKNDVKTRTEGQLRAACENKQQSQALVDIADQLPEGFKESAIVLQDNVRKDYSLEKYQTVAATNLKGKIMNISPNEGFVQLSALLDSNKDKNVGVATTMVGADYKLIVITNLAGTPVPSVYNISSPSGSNYQITGLDNDLLRKISVSQIAGKKCAYKYTNPTVRYYDSEPNKGMPAITPIDLNTGWYVYIPQTQGGVLSSGVQGYQSSGAVQFYYLCNVGSNGREDMKGNDDICQSFNINNYNNVDAFSGCSMTRSEIQSMAKKAEDVIKRVASQYKDGVSSVNIQGVGDNINVGAGMSGDGDLYQCQDFMSPEDCRIMYNVCDPVICPPSRCNFGGKIPVANVIQSGIIGSLVLCLPNSILLKGDVLIPVCLTGIHAGIEGYVSILKAQQACLTEYAKTGKHVGICDEMTAVYKCEFFWRQASPLIQNIIPKLFEFAYTGGYNKQSGGGEYAIFQRSWDNMQKSIDYFKNTYASTSFTALKFGNVQEVGSSFCKNFIGTSLPTSANALDAMLKPESPSQFYGKFSEIPLTDATVPASSQYKVYYHIYAGTDQGVRYTVYLKNPPATSYYQTAQTVVVKQGYIALGEQADEAIDFSAPAGYKELCIIINNQEECGFQSISTEFTINLVHDMYAKEQGNTENIETEKECIQGSPSVLALANTNLEAGADEAINPDISLRGINRVCATQNPGQGTNSVNWKSVGFCGDQKLTCWLDLSSVNNDAMNVLKKVGTIANTREVLSGSDPNVQYKDDLYNSAVKIEELKGDIKKLKEVRKTEDNNIDKSVDPLLVKIEDVMKYAYSDANKAELLLLKYRMYEVATRVMLGIKLENSAPLKAVTATADASTNTPVVVAQTIKKITRITFNDNYVIEDITSSSSLLNKPDLPVGEPIKMGIENDCASLSVYRQRLSGVLWGLFDSSLTSDVDGEYLVGDSFSDGDEIVLRVKCLDSEDKPQQSLHITVSFTKVLLGTVDS